MIYALDVRAGADLWGSIMTEEKQRTYVTRTELYPWLMQFLVLNFMFAFWPREFTDDRLGTLMMVMPIVLFIVMFIILMTAHIVEIRRRKRAEKNEQSPRDPS
ncbi:hypothetical protein HED60_02595 [Planctomycetales bacterium ZRK34]|nr:hypothetical protein HED60_02595 [Planctomycetales bacterium ZRK34]